MVKKIKKTVQIVLPPINNSPPLNYYSNKQPAIQNNTAPKEPISLTPKQFLQPHLLNQFRLLVYVLA